MKRKRVFRIRWQQGARNIISMTPSFSGKVLDDDDDDEARQPYHQTRNLFFKLETSSLPLFLHFHKCSDSYVVPMVFCNLLLQHISMISFFDYIILYIFFRVCVLIVQLLCSVKMCEKEKGPYLFRFSLRILSQWSPTSFD